MRKLYVLKMTVLLILGLSVKNELSQAQTVTTWYAINSGDWDNYNNWTLDPASAVFYNPTNSYPQNTNDNVVIKPGITIEVRVKDPAINLSCAILTVNGRLDLNASYGHSFTAIRGNGRILMEGDNFPTTPDASHFINQGQGGGTVVLRGSDFSLSSPHTFYNLEINDTVIGHTYTIDNDLILNGNLKLINGNLQINDIGSIIRNITVNGDITVNENNNITVGTGDAVHILNVLGDFTNSGSVVFSNSPQYSGAFNGAVKVYFKGSTNNDLVCNGPTHFYRMFVDKGTDKTYALSVNADDPDNFKLFGPIAGSEAIEGSDGTGGWERLALVLNNGTLKLESNINIPRLGENRVGVSPNEFHIPYTSMLWINGATIATSDAGGGWRGITIFGTLRVSDGSFTNPANSGGITYFSNTGSPGVLQIEDTGTIFTTQLKQANGSGKFCYFQSGGQLYISALSDSRISSAVFALPQSSHVFEMSGGKIIIDAINNTPTNGIHIGVSDGNYNVTGGTIEIKTPTLDAASETQFEINSTAPFYDLTISESVYAPGIQSVVLQEDLTILNNLTIGTGTAFNATGNTLSIGGNLTVSSGGVFTQTSGDIMFTGNSNSVVDNANAISFHNFVIDKNDIFTSELWHQVSFGGAAEVNIEGDLTITQGELNIGGLNIPQNGNINIVDGNIIGSGTLILAGTTQQTLKGKTGKEQSFGKIILNNSSGIKLLSNVNVESFDFNSNGVVDLNIYNLDIANGTFTSGGSWGNSRMFATSGLASNGGLTLPVSLNTTYTDEEAQFFPIGCIYNNNYYFTPATIMVNGSLSDAGKINVKYINDNHPTVDSPFGVVPFYWKANYTGLESLGTSNMRYVFTHYNNIWNLPSGRGMVFQTDNSWFDAGNDVRDGHNLDFDYNDPLMVDYSYGVSTAFNDVRTLYSRQSGDFSAAETWTTSPTHIGSPVNPSPHSYDMFVIGGDETINHQVYIDGGEDASQVYIKGKSETQIGFGNSQIAPPTLEIRTSADGPLTLWGGNNLNFIKGKGRFLLYHYDDMPTVDFTDFVNNDEAIFEYAGSNNYTIPIYTYFDLFGFEIPIFELVEYPNLYITGTGTKTAGNADLLINGDLYVDDATFRISNNAQGDLVILDSLIINTGNLILPNALARTISIEKDIVFTGSGTFAINTAGSPLNHQINLNGNITQGNGNIDLSETAFATVNFIGAESAVVSKTGTGDTDFHNITIIKPSDKQVHFLGDFNLLGSTNGTTKALTITSGECHLDNSNISIDLSTGGANFKIPSISALRVDNGSVVNVGGPASNTGIWLDGSLIIDNGGTVYCNQGTNDFTDNFIEYSSSGNATIWVGDIAGLFVGSQIRRATTTDAGILNFTQAKANSTITIGTQSAPVNNRGVFEIINTGSSFTQSEEGSNITIVRSQTAPTIASLYFDPETSSIAQNSGFTIGDESTPVDQTIGLYAGKSMMNLTIDGTNSPTAQLNIVPLTLNGSLSINTGIFDANGLDVTIIGDMVNNGLFLPNENSTYFSGTSNQSISGTGKSTFFNFEKNTGATTLSLLSDSITVTNKLTLRTGIFNTNENKVVVKGDASIFAGFKTYSSDASEGFIMQGTITQQLSGSGTFARLTIDNAAGVVIPTQASSINYSEALRLKQGILDIGRNLITIEQNATIEPVSAFSATNMIQTNISFTDAGILKYLPAGPLTEPFIFPIGSSGKYTPVSLTITGNSSSTGYVRVKAANECHITVLDPDNALHYNWTLDAANINDLSGSVIMQAVPSDVFYTNLDSLNAYIAARILTGSSQWEKLSNIYEEGELIEGFDKDNSLLKFRFINNNSSEINGDYTAGTAFAIPDEIPCYITVDNGDWTTPTTWARYFPDTNTIGEVGFVPRGSIIYVNKNLTISQNFMSAFRTNTLPTGIITVGNTINHRFGKVTGQGRLVLQNSSFPAGFYEEFFSENGGTIEFTGNTNYDVLSEKPSVNNLEFSGTGERRLASELTILGSLTISGAKLINENSQLVNIKKNVVFDSGSLVANTGTIVASGKTLQYIGGLASAGFTGTNAFYNLTLDNTAGLTLQNPLNISNSLTLTSGIINTTDEALLTLTNTNNTLLTGASSTRYINGPLQKNINATATFIFPVGNAARYGPITVKPNTLSGYWSAKYYNHAPSADGYTTMIYPIEYVSSNEYWDIIAPDISGAADVTVRWDANSGINPAEESNCLVTYKESPPGWTETVASFSGDATSGNAHATGLPFSSFSGKNRISFGSTSIHTYIWTGSIDANWFTPGNWSGSIVPSASAMATIASTSNNPVIAGAVIAQTNSLDIQTGATLTINPGGKLTVNGNLSITDNGGLIMANITGTNGLASLITRGTISGTANIWLELPANRWYYLSSPIENASMGIFDPGALGALVYLYHNQWISQTIDNFNSPLLDIEGVLVKYDAPKQLNYSGILNSGVTPISRSFDTGGWYLFGNPYPSSINWQEDEGWTRANIDGTMWYRTKIGEEMAFVTYNRYAVTGARAALYPDGTWGNETDLANIPPLQCVWVKAYSGGAILAVGNTTRTHGSEGIYLKSRSTNHRSDIIRITSSNSYSRDGSVVYFFDESVDNMDKGDSEKRFNDSDVVPEIYTRIGSTAAAINGLTQLGSQQRSIPLSVRNKINNPVILNFDLSMFQSDHSIELEDKITGVWTNMRTNPDYSYTPLTLGDVHDRFVIHVNQVPTSIVDPEEESNSGITITGSIGEAWITISDDLMTEDARIEVYTIDGKKVTETLSAAYKTLVKLPRVDAMFVIKVTAGGEVKTEKVLGKL